MYLWYQFVDGTGIHYEKTSSPLTNAVRRVRMRYRGKNWHLVSIGYFDQNGYFIHIVDDVLGVCQEVSSYE